jgi:putative DNA primase/helicase
MSVLESRGLWGDNCYTPVTKHEFDRERERQEGEALFEAVHLLNVARHAELKNPGVRDQMKPYFKGRGFDYVPECAMLLTVKQLQEAKSRLKHYGPTLKSFPAIITPVIGERGLQGAQLTYLSADMTKNLVSIKDPKKKSIRRFIGPAKGGAVIVRDLDPDQPLIIGESIEKAMSLSQVTGLPAISALGAGNMPKVVLPVVEGRWHQEYIIAGDNDDAGRKGAEALKDRLLNEGHRIRGPIYPPKKGDGWDDALHNCVDLEGWHDMILGSKAHQRKTIRALTMEEFMDLQFPDPEFLLEPWLTTTALGMIVAARGTAKTYIALSIAYAVATGKGLFRWKGGEPCKVIYFDGELPGARLQKRLKRLGPKTSNLKVVAREQFVLHRQLMPDLGTELGRKTIDAIIEAEDPDLIIFDSVSVLVRSGTENEAESWAPIQEWLLGHRWDGRTILLIHHEGKGGTPRGTSKREDVLDTVIRIKKHDEPRAGDDVPEGETSYELWFTKGRDLSEKDQEPQVVRLSIVDDVICWHHDSVKNDRNERIRSMLEQGMSPADIAKELGLTKGRISQIRKTFDIKTPQSEQKVRSDG